MIRELLWVIGALGGALGLLLWRTWEYGPLMEDLLSQETLWNFGRFYGATILARIVWSALRAIAKTF